MSPILMGKAPPACRAAGHAEEACGPVENAREEGVDRDRRRQRTHHVGCVEQQRVALAQRFPDEIELAILQVAQAAMDHA
jgi:hypothetical protein